MSDYQTIVENIRNLISFYGTSRDEQLEPLAESYTLASREVNARLLRCSQLIRAGNPSEAVRLADIEPNLLESFALLDFPERDQWCEIVRTFNFPAAPPLFEELAREVNDAYTTVDPLQPLLKKHRVLALVRAPVSERIPVLREMVLMEPENSGWKTDLDAYEKLRLREIEDDVNEAIAAMDVVKMSKLSCEIEQQNWITKPPEKLLSSLKLNLKAESQRGTMLELRQTAEKLQKAYSQQNAAAAIKYMDRWYSLSNQLGNVVPLELRFDIQTPIIWAEEQRQFGKREKHFENRVESFRSEMQKGIDFERMDMLYSELESEAEEIGLDIPESLTRLYASRREISQVRGIRRFRVFLLVVSILGVILCGGIAYGVFHFQHQGKVNAIAQTLQGYLDRKEYGTAEQYIEERNAKNPKFFDAPQIEAIYAELKTAINDEKERKTLFRTSLDKVKLSMNADVFDEHSLIQAQARAGTEEEKIELREVENELRRNNHEKRRIKDLALQKEVDAISAEMRKYLPQNGAENETALTKLLNEALKLRDIDDASDKVKNERDLMIGQLEQWTAEIKQRKESKGDISDLTRMVSDPEGYAKTLQALADKYPNLPMSADFQTVLREEKAIETKIQKWNATVMKLPDSSQPSGLDEIVQTSGKVHQFLADWINFAPLLTDFPDREAVEDSIPYLKAKAAREKNGESILAGFERQMNTQLSRPVWMYYSEREDARYYLLAVPKVGRNRCWADKGGKETSVQIPDSAAKLLGDEPAPQVVFAKTAIDTIRKIETPDGIPWAYAACDLLQKLQDDPKLDPLLKYILLEQLISTFGTGDLSVQKGYGRHLLQLREEEIDKHVDWINPKSLDAKKERNKAKKVLAGLPPSGTAVEATLKDAESIGKRSIMTYLRIGWAEKLGDGSWICNTNRTNLPRSGLVVFRGTTEQDEITNIRSEPLELVNSETKKIVPNSLLIFGLPIYLKVPR